MAEKKKKKDDLVSQEQKIKEESLKLTVEQIHRKFGKGALMTLGAHDVAPIESISTGALSLDLALGVNGGPPRPDYRNIRPRILGKNYPGVAYYRQCTTRAGTGSFYRRRTCPRPDLL